MHARALAQSAAAVDDGDLADRYDAIWRTSRDALRRNEVAVDPPPREGEMRWGVSVVLRPVLPRSVWAALAELTPALGREHAYYTDRNVHVTIRSVERYRSAVTAGDGAVRDYAEAARRVFARQPTLAVDFAGVVASATSLLLCGYPRFDIVGLRRALHAELAQIGRTQDSPEPREGSLRTTCHASLAVFAGPLADPEAAISRIDRSRLLEFGSVVCDDIQLVSYQRAGNDIRVNRLVSI